MLLRDDQPEKTQIAQPLNELRRLLRLAIPTLEVGVLRSEELIDRLDHHAEDLAILGAQPRVGKEILLEYPTRE